jgi:hypothetical protein
MKNPKYLGLTYGQVEFLRKLVFEKLKEGQEDAIYDLFVKLGEILDNLEDKR